MEDWRFTFLSVHIDRIIKKYDCVFKQTCQHHQNVLLQADVLLKVIILEAEPTDPDEVCVYVGDAAEAVRMGPRRKNTFSLNRELWFLCLRPLLSSLLWSSVTL